MFKNYVKIAWKVMQRRKFFTFINMFGISFTLMILTIIIAIVDYQIGSNSVDSNREKCLYVNTIELYNGERWERHSPSVYFLKKYIKSLSSPAKITIHSSTNFSEYKDSKKLNGVVNFSDSEYWSVLTFNFIQGKPYNQSDVESGAKVAVINTKYRNDVFGNSSVEGKYVEVKGVKYRIVGVVSDLPLHTNIWVPYTTDNRDSKKVSLVGSYSATLMARSNGEFARISKEIGQMEKKVELPDPNKHEALRVFADDSIEKFARSIGPNKEIVFAVIFIFMFLFMLLPAINLININISRIIERTSEIGVRKAFGASSLTLVQQFVIENILFTIIGGIISLALAYLFLKMMGVAFPGMEGINIRIFTYSMIVSVIFGFVSGVYPAYKMSKLNVVEALKVGKI